MKRLFLLGSLIFVIVALVLTGCVGKKTNNPPKIESATLSATQAGVYEEVSVTYTVSDPDGDSVTVTVYWGDGATSSSNETSGTLKHSYTKSGTYSVKISVSDGVNTVEKDLGSVKITESQIPDIKKFVIEKCKFFENETIPGTILVYDEDATLNAWIYWDSEPFGAGIESKHLTVKTGEEFPFSFAIPEEGTYYIWMKLIDSEGNVVETRGTEQATGWVVQRQIFKNASPTILRIYAETEDGIVEGSEDGVSLPTINMKDPATLVIEATDPNLGVVCSEKLDVDLGLKFELASTSIKITINKDDVEEGIAIKKVNIKDNLTYLGTTTITATVTDRMKAQDKEEKKIFKVVNRVPKIVEFKPEGTIYEDEPATFVVAVEDKDVDYGLDTLKGTLTINDGVRTWTETVNFDNATTTKVSFDFYPDTRVMNVTLDVEDSYGGKDSDATEVIVVSGLYADASVVFYWVDAETGDEASYTYNVDTREDGIEEIELPDEVKVKMGNDNFDKLKLRVKINETNIYQPYVHVRYSVNGGNTYDMYDYTTDSNGWYELNLSPKTMGITYDDYGTTSYIEFRLNVESEQQEFVPLADATVNYYEGNDPEGQGELYHSCTDCCTYDEATFTMSALDADSNIDVTKTFADGAIACEFISNSAVSSKYIAPSYTEDDVVEYLNVESTETTPGGKGASASGTIHLATDFEYEGTLKVTWKVWDVVGNATEIVATTKVDYAAPRLSQAESENFDWGSWVGQVNFDDDPASTRATAAISVEDMNDYVIDAVTSGSLTNVSANLDETNDVYSVGFNLATGDYYYDDWYGKSVGTITVTATDSCGTDTTDANLAKWHTRTITFDVKIDNLLWKSSDILYAVIDDNDDASSPDILYITVGREGLDLIGGEATCSLPGDATSASILVYDESGFIKIAQASGVTINTTGATWTTFAIKLDKSIASGGQDINEGNTYKVVVEPGVFGIDIGGAIFWNNKFTRDAEAVKANLAPQSQ